MDRKHMLVMLLCCLAPILAISALFLLQVPISTLLLLALVMICPLSHLLMMRHMDHEAALTTDDHHPHADESGA